VHVCISVHTAVALAVHAVSAVTPEPASPNAGDEEPLHAVAAHDKATQNIDGGR
jgi:hypothetical protein